MVRTKAKKAFSWLYLVLIVLFLYLPIFVLIALSFNESEVRGNWTHFTLKWYENMFASSKIMGAFGNTIFLAVLSAFIATVIGLLASIGIDAMRRKEFAVVMGVTNIPMLNADIVTAVATMLFLSRFMNLGFGSVLIAHVTFNIPYVILSVLPKFSSVDSSTYEAARDLGASATKAFFKVVLPELIPGIVSGFCLAVTMSMDDYVITLFSKGAGFNTLSTMVYSEFRKGIKPEMYALSSVLFTTVLILLIIVNVISEVKARKERKEQAIR